MYDARVHNGGSGGSRRGAGRTLHNAATRMATACAALLALLLLCAGTAPTFADTTTRKSGESTFEAYVLSNTVLNLASCGSLVQDITYFGDVLTESNNITPENCSIVFGSSSDTAHLKLFQGDGIDKAMWLPTDGTLDADYDGDTGPGNGIVASDMTGTSDVAVHAALQADGKLVVLGRTHNGSDYDWYLARFTTAGLLDTTFNGTGIATPAWGGSNDYPSEVAIQSDGKIVAVGAAPAAALARFNSNGTLDTSFDGPSGSGNGKFAFSINGNATTSEAVEIQSDGKIVVGGRGYPAGDTFTAIMRFNADGSFDYDFGKGTGWVMVETYAGPDEGYALELLQNGDIAVGGYRAAPAFSIGLANKNGIYKSYNAIVLGTNDVTKGIAEQPDGKIILLGTTTNSNQDIGIMRVTSALALDNTFDGPGGAGNGKFAIDINNAADTVENDPIVLADGKIMFVATSSNGANNDITVVRLNPTGTYDTTFGGGDGILQIDTDGAGGSDAGNAIVGSPDGDVYAVGRAIAGGNQRIGLVRMKGTSINDFQSGSFDWSTGANAFGACLHTVANNAAGGGGNGWTVAGNGNCTTAISANWNPIVISSGTAGAKVATSTVSTTQNATANLRFGFRTSSNQKPGAYIAPVTFEVTAPNA